METPGLLVAVVLITFLAVGFVLMQAGVPFSLTGDKRSSCPTDVAEEINFLKDVVVPFVDNVEEPQFEKRAQSIKKNYWSAEQFYKVNRCQEAKYSAETANNEYELLVGEMSQES